jgi:hypothetical protein
MDFFKLGKIGAKAHWKKYNGPIIEHITNNHSVFLKEKARVIGFIMGDGSITRIDRCPALQHHDISFYPDDEVMLNLFLDDFEKLYLKKPRVKNLGKYYCVRVNSKPACDDLRSYGSFSSLEWKFPIKLKTQEEKIEWIKAIFDCEAYVGPKDIRIQSVSKQGIESVQKLLNDLGISSKIYTYKRKNKNHNLNYILCITNKENIKKYNSLIGFNHSKKSIKLKNMPACQNG